MQPNWQLNRRRNEGRNERNEEEAEKKRRRNERNEEEAKIVRLCFFSAVVSRCFTFAFQYLSARRERARPRRLTGRGCKHLKNIQLINANRTEARWRVKVLLCSVEHDWWNCIVYSSGFYSCSVLTTPGFHSCFHSCASEVLLISFQMLTAGCTVSLLVYYCCALN